MIKTSAGSAGWNMGLDEALWRSFSWVGRPTLRIYRWAEPTVSIGYSMKVGEIELGECARLGIGFVRRPTGGRAVLHDLEATYSLVHPLEGMGSVPESHRRIGEALVMGLGRLGLAAEIDVMIKRGRASFSAACFEAPSQFELTIAGRKVAGCAQVRDHLALLEHGSIPLELDLKKLAAILQPNGLPQAKFENLLRRRAGGLRDFTAGELRLEEAEEAIIAGFAERFRVRLVEGFPTAQELELAEELAERKYSDPGWNLRK